MRSRPEKNRDPLHLVRNPVRYLEVGVRRPELNWVVSPDFLALIPEPPFRLIKLAIGHKVHNSLSLSLSIPLGEGVVRL